MNVGDFLGVFALIFLVELPDKTFIATVIMSTRARVAMVILGSSCALVVHMGIAVAAGSLLDLVPVHIKDLVIAALFFGGAAYLLFVTEDEEFAEGAREAKGEHRATHLQEAATAFGVVFVGEFGDLSQIQAANMVAKTHDPLLVFVAASLALISVTTLAALGGRALLRVIPLRRVRLLGGLVFAGLGVWTIVSLIVS